ncbi:P-loop NTPase family protein [Vagococcus silagei]|uniref:DNA topology modulation protein FlaR n=1 Tax=Vagococcus silagei TaxID=2508885 RepID=A0A4S3B4H5_9ENTE|nr:hypothetical protein [Vagococcus silagei]THB61951.1 hypothetical protein ESZ54_01725 [Vagococcus silagei]
MNIRIIGYAGSGKTSLALAIQKKYRIQGISLDDYLQIKNKSDRARQLEHDLYDLRDWTTEGVQLGQWCQETLTRADLIILLDYPLLLVQYRVVKRAFLQVFEKERDFSQKIKVIKRMFKLFKWNVRFKKRLPEIKKNLYLFPAELIILEHPEDEVRFHQFMKSNFKRKIKKRKR